MQLRRLGFKFEVAGGKVRYRHDGLERPDPGQARLLLDVVKENKEEVRYFLKSHCSRCGGVATCPDYEGRPLCLECDWEKLVRLYPALGNKH